VVDSHDSGAADLPFLPQAGRVVWIGGGPDGSVYRLTITGELFRARYQSGSLFPITGAVNANPTSGLPPVNVRFSASATDPDGDALTFRWRFDDQTTLNGATVNRTFTTAGRHENRLEVSDGTDAVFLSPLTIEVGGNRR
jgi:hypothetical protein